MPDLLLELLTEEIPARMQANASADLARLAAGKLSASGLTPEKTTTYTTPRRLVLHIEGLAAEQTSKSEERRGPREGAPPAAIDGFLKSTGIASLDRCELRDTGKGKFYFAIIERPGRRTRDALPGLLREVVLELAWPKSMRFPAASFRWVRPLTSVLSLFDSEVLPLDLGGVPVGDVTQGHRFLSDGPIAVMDFASYRKGLRNAKVILDPAERRAEIARQIVGKTAVLGLTAVRDEALLDEVTGLVEWPVALVGNIEPRFMDLPPEVLTTSMRSHQKYFACAKADGSLSPHFVVIANNETADGGQQIQHGNERVLRARLSDAQFFWDNDRKQTLESRVDKLGERVFHAKLGTVLDKINRMGALANSIAPWVPGANAELVRRAIQLAKADLSTGLVGEFPELQGVMGRYLAQHDGEAAEVVEAIAWHYAPVGASDIPPSQPVAVATALADKIDTLVGFFTIDERPTGSKDPYALRRAALGVIRVILENGLRLPLRRILGDAMLLLEPNAKPKINVPDQLIVDRLMDFLAERLRVSMKEIEGFRFDQLNAVFALGDEDDLVRLVSRTNALQIFIDGDDGANLLTAYRRASRIVQIEEKKDEASFRDAPDPALFELPEEVTLGMLLLTAEASARDALAKEDFTAAMLAMAQLRKPVDDFFDRVTVNVETAALRQNRLRLLAQIGATLDRVADFSKVEG